MSDAGACESIKKTGVIEPSPVPFLSRVSRADLDAALAIIKELKDDHGARAAAWAVVREVPQVLALVVSVVPAVAGGALTKQQAWSQVVASGLVLPVISAASRAYPDAAAALVARLLPLLRKAGFSDEQVAGEQQQQQARRATRGPQGACV